MDRSIGGRRDVAHRVAARPTGGRWKVLTLVALGTTINYLDRTLLSVAGPGMARDLHFDPAVMGVVFSAFSWSYALAQIPGGAFLDRYGVRITYFLSAAFWSLFTALQTFTAGIGTLLALRLGLGAAEAPCFPANSRILCSWFPQHERARANGVYSVGMYFGIAFLSPLLFWITATWGWRSLFAIVGLIGLAFAAVWLWLYREPQDSRWANPAERDYMRLHVGRRSWLIHHSMAALEEGLNPELFVRLHRSAIVRKDFITGFTRNPSGRWIARLADGVEQPVGRLYSDRVRAIAGR